MRPQVAPCHRVLEYLGAVQQHASPHRKGLASGSEENIRDGPLRQVRNLLPQHRHQIDHFRGDCYVTAPLLLLLKILPPVDPDPAKLLPGVPLPLCLDAAAIRLRLHLLGSPHLLQDRFQQRHQRAPGFADRFLDFLWSSLGFIHAGLSVCLARVFDFGEKLSEVIIRRWLLDATTAVVESLVLPSAGPFGVFATGLGAPPVVFLEVAQHHGLAACPLRPWARRLKGGLRRPLW
mmetsp:Transcript_25423/g.64573  ORF Transcript_25423/g.64573 Transcript_25423/m.64573 type:complete len:234 (-) Transcript_25423:801-1502(-)